MGRAETYGDRALWERIVYKTLYKAQTIRACVRPGDRSDPEKTPLQWLPLNTSLPVRFLARPGVQDAGIAAIFTEDDGTTVVIKRRIVKPIGELTAEDLAGGAPDTATPELVRFHIGLHANCPLPPLTAVVTVYHFEYVDPT
ncbi:MAG: hypothetical protein Q7S48_03165 [bacterium]|nr:hypothetical protein [bacterium]